MYNDPFRDFYRGLGKRVITSPSAYWVEVQPGVLLSIPHHRLIDPPERELDELLQRAGAVALRYPTTMEKHGFDSNMPACRSQDYSIENLPRTVRNRVRKGMENCQVRLVTKEELEKEGVLLNQKTCRRQKRHDPKENLRYWQRLCHAVTETDGAIVWGAFRENRLVAYLIVLETPSAAEFIIQNSDSDFLKFCPNNALLYIATRHYLVERNPALPICYGLGSLEETPTLDRYKVGMGYVLEPIKQRIYIRRSLSWLCNSYTLATLEVIAKGGFGQNYYLRKTIAMIKRYLSQDTVNITSPQVFLLPKERKE